MPCMTIANNAGVDAAVVVSKVLDASGDLGYDALNDEYVNMIEKGIIDPTKVSELMRRTFVTIVILWRYIFRGRGLISMHFEKLLI